MNRPGFDASDLGRRTHALLLELHAYFGNWQEVEHVVGLMLDTLGYETAFAAVGEVEHA
jgi:hypothetical protein